MVSCCAYDKANRVSHADESTSTAAYFAELVPLIDLIDFRITNVVHHV